MDNLEASKMVIIQNLEDAGCEQSLIYEFIQSDNFGTEKQLYLLNKHRRTILDQIHEDQKKLDCLDYLIYQLKHNEWRKYK